MIGCEMGQPPQILGAIGRPRYEFSVLTNFVLTGFHCKCLLQAISPFLTMFSKAIYVKCIKMWHCVVMGYYPRKPFDRN